jgi:hypothetical protein
LQLSGTKLVLGNSLLESFRDPRLSSFGQDSKKWRNWLRTELYEARGGNSDLSGVILHGGFDMHEGIIPRAVVPRSIEWHYMIYHEINCFMLLRDEHIPQPPTRTECYWLAVARYGYEAVEAWIDSLPWKAPIERPWAGSRGVTVISELYMKRRMTNKHIEYLRSKFNELDCEA